MRDISSQEYQALIDNSRLIEKDGYGPKVLLTQDQQIVKIFRCKRFLSRTTIFPAGRRFANNAVGLKERGIDTITIEDYGRCPDPPRELVWYPYLEGETLRDICLTVSKPEIASLVRELGTFIAVLHLRGVFFRSLHWNNILVQPSGRFALIDILDMQLQKRSLSILQRRRNFCHLLCRHPQDLQIYQENFEVFWHGYADACGLTAKQLLSLKRIQFELRK